MNQEIPVTNENTSSGEALVAPKKPYNKNGKDKKYNGFLRNSNRKNKDDTDSSKNETQTKIENTEQEIKPEAQIPSSEQSAPNLESTMTPVSNFEAVEPVKKVHKVPVHNHANQKKPNPNQKHPNQKNNNPNNPNAQSHKPKHKPHLKNNNKPQLPVDSDIINENHIKEDYTSPEYLMFSYLRQKTGTHPTKFWENFHVCLKEKNFADLKRSEMSLISYAALYESVDIFETLLYDYGHLIPQKEIESSIFKLSTNKDPIILHHTISFYNTHYKPSEEFINEYLSLAAKASYREAGNQLIANWLGPKMSDNNKENFWKICLENKNIPFMTVALENKELNTYLKNHQEQFSELIKKSGRENTIYKSLSKSLEATQDLAPAHKKETSGANSSVTPINDSPKMEDTKIKSWLGNADDKLKVLQQEENKTITPEITFKKKRKIV
jgi:hypothetical protein